MSADRSPAGILLDIVEDVCYVKEKMHVVNK